ncbi:MAG: queuosine precursor transporter [Tepidamorphaceae bacterium]|nr:queuosine precursor transporter [Rhodobiaceae bacterium]MCC0049906.1 queuosine precursor transporter [Rhodobiaceae bacterium]
MNASSPSADGMFSRGLIAAVAAMCGVVALSNFAVQHPFMLFGLQDYFTWGTFTYPLAFLITDLTNRRYGPAMTRRVVFAGFVLAVILSVVLATPRIAIASGTAFLTAQLLDVSVFDRLRQSAWWKAPLVSSLIGSAVDTAMFFTLAFAGTGMPEATYPVLGGITAPVWMGWAFFDWLAKLACAGAMLVPFRALMSRITPLRAAAS